MANWNSSTKYSEKDMLTMQQDAMRRVKEMQARAMKPFEQQYPPQPAAVNKPHFTNNSDTSQPKPNQHTTAQMQPQPQQMNHQNTNAEHKAPAAPQMQNNRHDNPLSFLNLGSLTNGGGLTSILGNFLGNASDKTPLGGVLKALDLDTEKLVIIGLMIILYNEGADALLLIALAYLLI